MEEETTPTAVHQEEITAARNREGCRGNKGKGPEGWVKNGVLPRRLLRAAPPIKAEQKVRPGQHKIFSCPGYR